MIWNEKTQLLTVIQQNYYMRSIGKVIIFDFQKKKSINF